MRSRTTLHLTVHLALVLAGAALLIPLVLRAFDAPLLAQDEGILLVYPQRVLAGDVPNRDFEHLYGPANLWLLAAVYSVAPDAVITERVVGLLYRAAIVLGVFVIARRFGDGAAFGAALISSLCLIARGMGAYAFTAGVALVLWSGYLNLLAAEAARWNSVRFSRLTALRVGGGVLAGLAVLFRIDLAPVALAVLAAGVAAQRKRDGVLPCLAGLALGLAPMLAHVAIAGVSASYEGMIEYPFLELPAGRRLPFPPDETRIRMLLTLSAITMTVLLARAGVDLARRRFTSTSQAALTGGVLAAGLAPQALQRIDIGHALWLSTIAVAFLPAAVGIAVDAVRPIPRRARHMGMVAGVAIATGLTAIFLHGIADDRLRPSQDVVHAGRRVPMETYARAQDLGALLDRTDSTTEKGDRLVVVPAESRRTNYNDTFIYFLLPKLEPATYYLEMNPWSANGPGSRLAEDIASADVVIASRRHDIFNEDNRSDKLGSDAPQRVLSAQFCLVARHGSWDLLLRCR